MKVLFALLAGLLMAPILMLSTAQAQDAYQIRPGDVLRIEVLEDATLNRSSLVPPDGRISLPLAGSLAAAGRSVEEVQADLIARLTPSFAAAPNVFVSIDQIAQVDEPVAFDGPAPIETVRIYLLGEVGKPGRLEVAEGTTLLQLFAEMGGFSNFAATKRIQLRRTDSAGVTKIYGFNYEAIVNGTSQSGNTVMGEGDVIIVPQRRLFE